MNSQRSVSWSFGAHPLFAETNDMEDDEHNFGRIELTHRE